MTYKIIATVFFGGGILVSAFFLLFTAAFTDVGTLLTNKSLDA
jgi:hypothetical protein